MWIFNRVLTLRMNQFSHYVTSKNASSTPKKENPLILDSSRFIGITLRVLDWKH